MDAIATEIENCRACKKDKIGMAVPGEGNPDAQIVFIGEAPGKTEAQTGRPFIGRAGKLLRTLIKDAGLFDEHVYITSPVKYLPKHVTPKPAEIEHGKKHLDAQLNIIEPKFVVLLGNVACLALLKQPVKIAQDHGKIIKDQGRTYFVSYHPAAALHQPNTRPLLIKDFKMLKKLLAD